jgi:ubiquinone/menaquinone biosynthesis C-methylase UbiE
LFRISNFVLRIFSKHMPKQKFIQPEKVLTEAGLASGMAVADLGSGNGFFTLPAAKAVGDRGLVWAVDILDEALGQVSSSARMERLKNIRTHKFDLESFNPCGVPDLSCDFVIVGKVLSQMKNTDNLVRQAWRILKTGGTVLILEWKKARTPLGPAFEGRLSAEKARECFVRQGFKFLREMEPDSYHYALVFQK